MYLTKKHHMIIAISYIILELCTFLTGVIMLGLNDNHVIQPTNYIIFGLSLGFCILNIWVSIIFIGILRNSDNNYQQINKVSTISYVSNFIELTMYIIWILALKPKEMTMIYYYNIYNLSRLSLISLLQILDLIRLKLVDRHSRKIYWQQYADKNNLELIDFRKLTTDQKNDCCPICLVNFEEKNTEMCKIVECNHLFHLECLSKWFEQNKSCPLCRGGKKINHAASFAILVQAVPVDPYPASPRSVDSPNS